MKGTKRYMYFYTYTYKQNHAHTHIYTYTIHLLVVHPHLPHMRMSTQPSHHLRIWPPWLFQGGNHRINAWMQGINHQTRLKKALVDDPFHQLFNAFCIFLLLFIWVFTGLRLDHGYFGGVSKMDMGKSGSDSAFITQQMVPEV